MLPLALAPEASASLLGYALKKTPQRTEPGIRPLLRPCEVSAGTPGSTGENEMVEHQGIAPCIPVWKTGVYLSTPMLEKIGVPSWSCTILHGFGDRCLGCSANGTFKRSGRVVAHPPALIAFWRL